MPFETPLKVMLQRGSGDRELIDCFHYIDKHLGDIEVPKGFITNYASIPKIIPRWWLDSDGILIREPSVIHDWLYSTKCFILDNRREADRVFLRAMLELHTKLAKENKYNWFKRSLNRIKIYSAYYSVRVAGKSYWKIKERI